MQARKGHQGGYFQGECERLYTCNEAACSPLCVFLCSGCTQSQVGVSVPAYWQMATLMTQEPSTGFLCVCEVACPCTRVFVDCVCLPVCVWERHSKLSLMQRQQIPLSFCSSLLPNHTNPHAHAHTVWHYGFSSLLSRCLQSVPADIHKRPWICCSFHLLKIHSYKGVCVCVWLGGNNRNIIKSHQGRFMMVLH